MDNKGLIIFYAGVFFFFWKLWMELMDSYFFIYQLFIIWALFIKRLKFVFLFVNLNHHHCLGCKIEVRIIIIWSSIPQLQAGRWIWVLNVFDIFKVVKNCVFIVFLPKSCDFLILLFHWYYITLVCTKTLLTKSCSVLTYFICSI